MAIPSFDEDLMGVTYSPNIAWKDYLEKLNEREIVGSMNENGVDRIRVMEILNRSQYNDEVIDGLDMRDSDLTF